MRNLTISLSLALLCASATTQMPGSSAELEKLDRLLGHWQGTGTVGGPEGPMTTWTATVDARRVLGGHWLRQDMTVEFELLVEHRGARVRGVAYDAGGRRVAGALARISPPGRSPWVSEARTAITRGWAPVLVRTDERGAFEAAGLPPGELTVQVRARGHGTFRGRLTVEAGSAAEITATLPAPKKSPTSSVLPCRTRTRLAWTPRKQRLGPRKLFASPGTLREMPTESSG